MIKSLIVVLCFLWASIALAQSAEFTVKKVIEVTANATIVVALEKDGKIVPVPVRLKGIIYPKGQQSLSDLVAALKEYLKEAENTQFRIVSVSDEFELTETGILLCGVEVLSNRIAKSGARVSGSQDLVANLLNFGSCTYDGSLGEKDASRHKAYSTTQDHAKNNLFGVWSTE